MASEKHKKNAETVDEAARTKKDKKDKKDKKRSESDGVHKSSKKDKKEKKSKERLERALDEHLQASAAASVADPDVDASSSSSEPEQPEAPKALVVKGEMPKGALVEFALPLADEKVQKKVYKTMKKATKTHALLRGVKEVNKALRKAPLKTAGTTDMPGIVIIAGDISPAEVIMHLPVFCEEHNVPYLFVSSRAELGAAAKTKRPTSVVMLLAKGRKPAGSDKKKKEKEETEDEDDYPKAWKELAATAKKEFAKQLKTLL